MFGIFFTYHPNLRKILTDYGFIGFPLRKDFPLSGYEEIFYNDTAKKIKYIPISLTQEYRIFNYTNP
jgi:NADH-quinone oxidoreductase subunit C